MNTTPFTDDKGNRTIAPWLEALTPTSLTPMGIPTGLIKAGYDALAYSPTDKYNSFKKDLKTQDVETVKTIDAINKLHYGGYIDANQYQKAIKVLDDYEASQKTGGIEGALKKIWFNVTTSASTRDNLKELYGQLHANADKIPSNLGLQDFMDIIDGTSSGTLNLPAPGGVGMINPNAGELPVDPVKRYTNQELADLYQINYDVDHYYDLIKQGTQAEIAKQDFNNEQAWDAARYGETAARNSYLDANREAKSEAITSGATMGARAAAEILANTEAAQAQANTMAETGANNVNNISNAYLEDSMAMRDALDYRDNTLGRSLAANLEDLYLYDNQRWGSDVIRNANIYAANQNYNAAAIQANAAMQAAYQTATAGAQAAANNQKFVVNQLYHSYDDSVAKGYMSERDRMTRVANDYMNYAANYYQRNATGVNTGGDFSTYLANINK